MSSLLFETASITLEPSQVGTNSPVSLEGTGFLVDSLVDIEIVLPRGSLVTATLQADATGSFASIEAANPASGYLISTGVLPALDDTVTIDGVVYIFKATVGATADEVLVGEYASESLANLKSAINLGNEAGETYGSATVLHATVEAGVLTEESLQLFAKTPGTDGNALAVAESSGELSFADSTLLGGQEASSQSKIGFAVAESGIVTVKASDGTNEATAELQVWHST